MYPSTSLILRIRSNDFLVPEYKLMRNFYLIWKKTKRSDSNYPRNARALWRIRGRGRRTSCRRVGLEDASEEINNIEGTFTREEL